MGTSHRTNMLSTRSGLSAGGLTYVSTDSEYDSPSEKDARVRPCLDAKIAERRRRNGESAKRSRQKRKAKQMGMENGYNEMAAANAKLVEENTRLRELIASLGGTASSVAQTNVSEVPPLSTSNNHMSAKRVKRECRVALTANSIESEATQPTSQQLEPTPHQLAVTTTALLLTLLSTMTSSKLTEPQMPRCLTSPESTRTTSSACVRSSRSAIPLNPNILGSASQSYQKTTTAPKTLTSGD